MAEELGEAFQSKLQISSPTSVGLIVVASTFMSGDNECVIVWSEVEGKLLRPVTNLATNSWKIGTFKVGYKYQFVIVDSNPANAKWPHKSEDTIVQLSAVPLNSTSPKFTEAAMYTMLFGRSVESVLSVFAPGIINEEKYIIAGMECPSVGVLRCTLSNISMYSELPFQPGGKPKVRCKVFGNYDFPVTAQNRDTLIQELSNVTVPSSYHLLVLLGLARPFSGPTNNPFVPPRCYIMVIGVIRAFQ